MAGFNSLPRPMRTVTEPDMAKLDALSAGAPSRSLPVGVAPEVPPLVAVVPEPVVEAAPAPAPEPKKVEKLVQVSGRVSESEYTKLRMHCIYNRTSIQAMIQQMIRNLP